MDRLSNITKQQLAAQQVTSEEHPSADTLAAFAEQGLRGSQRQRVVAHLAVCPACRQTVSLAVSAEEVSSAAVPTRSRELSFSAVLKWASAAAALAVAVGAGVLSYEHQNRPAVSAVASASQNQETALAPAAQPAASQKSVIADNVKAEPETPAAISSRRTISQARVTANAFPGRPEAQLKKAQSAAVLGGLVGGTPSTTLPQPNVADSFVASNGTHPAAPIVTPADAKAGAFSDVAQAPSAAVAGIPAPSASAQPSLARSNVQLQEANSAERSTLNGAAKASLQQRGETSAEMKAVASSAIGGPLRTGAVHGFTPIAHWTISPNGKLQRQSGDGRFTSIEPAPGVSIRTVAAQGIEVWAAGSQPDLSVKQWQQRPVLFHSSDAGETWMQIAGPWQSPITALTLSGANMLTVVSAEGSWTTNDAGRSWTKK